MSIKSIYIFASLALLLTACAKENSLKDQPAQVSVGADGDCLSNFGQHLREFKMGAMSEAQVETFWSCVDQAVGDYQRLTTGDKANGAYAPKALRRFFKKYFAKSEDIGDSLLASLMEIKRLLLRGDELLIQPAEIGRLRELIARLRQATLDVNPYAKIIFLQNESATDQEIERAGRAGEKAIRRLGDWLAESDQEYSFASLAKMVDQIEEFRGNKSADAQAFADIRKALTVLPSAKRLLLAGPDDRFLGQEWSRLAKEAAFGLRGFLAMKYAFHEDLNTALAREAVPLGLDPLLALVETAMQAHPGSALPLAMFRDLFLALEKTDWLPKEFTADNSMFALSWVIDRTLARGLNGKAEALTLEHLGVLQSVVHDWRSLLKMARGEAEDQGEVNQSFRAMLARSAPHEWDSAGRMAFPLKPARQWSEDGLKHMIWPFVVMSWLKDAFVPRDQFEVNDEVMESAGLEVLTTLRRFGWLLETKDTIGKKLLREADLFTLGSNGNGTVDLYEATRYLAFIASAYRAATVWLEQADLVCGGPEAVCTRQLGADFSRPILTSMPRLQNWLREKNTVPRLVNYMQAAEETILEKVIEGKFSTGDVLQVWMLFQYAETFLQRYDLDANDTISLKEATPAFEVFGPILGKMLSRVGLPADELFGFFTFMMKYGDTPFTMFGGQILYNHWKWHRNDWAFESDRTHLMGILNQLSKL